MPDSEQIPIAIIDGDPYLDVPKDLFIPPEALRVFLESFEGPLDLLLYLIKRQNIDILNIPMAEITRQYIQYIDLMTRVQFDLAAEYLVMAAMLTEIKSRMLLPRSKDTIDDEEDPRAELIRRLQVYEQFKLAAVDLDALPRLGRDFHQAHAELVQFVSHHAPPEVSLEDVLVAFKSVLQRAKMFTHHHIQRESLSVRERMSTILSRLTQETFTEFHTLFEFREGRMGVVTAFLAILELKKAMVIELVQNEPFGSVYVRMAGQNPAQDGQGEQDDATAV